MALELTLDTRELEEMLRSIPKAEGIIAENAEATMGASVDLVVGEVAARTPVNTGALRGSIAGHVRGRFPADLTGTITTPLIYGAPVEFGRQPGRKQPPLDAIELWVRRQLGISGDEARSAAYVIARAIGRRGIKGVFMFREGFAAAEPLIIRLWQDMTGKTAVQIERALT